MLSVYHSSVLHGMGVSVGRGSWVLGPSRGSWVQSRGSWVPSRGSLVPSRGWWVIDWKGSA